MIYNSCTVPGRDYNTPLLDLLPTIIGKRSKSIPQIAEAGGRQRQTVTKLIARLHQQNVVHIKRWTRTTGPYVANYKWGSGVDAPRPQPEDRSVIHKRYRTSEKGRKTCKICAKRWRKSERGQEYVHSANKARWAREKFSKGGIAAIDPLLAAMMGQRKQPQQERQ